jgi:hypothetical protein
MSQPNDIVLPCHFQGSLSYHRNIFLCAGA